MRFSAAFLALVAAAAAGPALVSAAAAGEGGAPASSGLAEFAKKHIQVHIDMVCSGMIYTAARGALPTAAPDQLLGITNSLFLAIIAISPGIGCPPVPGRDEQVGEWLNSAAEHVHQVLSRLVARTPPDFTSLLQWMRTLIGLDTVLDLLEQFPEDNPVALHLNTLEHLFYGKAQEHAYGRTVAPAAAGLSVSEPVDPWVRDLSVMLETHREAALMYFDTDAEDLQQEVEPQFIDPIEAQDSMSRIVDP